MEPIIEPVSRSLLLAELTPERKVRNTNKASNEIYIFDAAECPSLLREIGRLETSLKAAGDHEKLCFLHYPPLYQGYQCPEILRLLREYEVKVCCYGHLHGASHRRALQGERGGTSFFMVSGDYLSFHPKKICD